MNTFDGTFGHFSNFVHVGKDLDLVRTRHTKRFNSYLAAVQQPGASIRPYLTTSASSILFSRNSGGSALGAHFHSGCMEDALPPLVPRRQEIATGL